jgi:hypothetical protein
VAAGGVAEKRGVLGCEAVETMTRREGTLVGTCSTDAFAPSSSSRSAGRSPNDGVWHAPSPETIAGDVTRRVDDVMPRTGLRTAPEYDLHVPNTQPPVISFIF